ncbi:DUF1659 domain-containing protein [Alicyclobacillus kakegawensis]|uniref:DUF1659 domain-containing protein n=1 Tax=Alicyclobacillus kakegawensis TaxID=392012 RepID=UPI00083102B6|nr:DUF1659 domain-containing protein [Alicyclobacillus kakegawensis]
MANVNPLSTRLQIQVQTGTMADGSPKIGTYSFANVSPQASDDDVLAVGQALGALFAEPLLQVVRVNQDALSSATA